MKTFCHVLTLGITSLAAITAFASTPAQASLEIDRAHSRIEYVVGATMHSFTGTVKAYELTLKAGAPEKIDHAELRLRWTDMNSKDEKRDHEMIEWAEAAKFPEVNFSLITLTPAEKAGHYTARGRLTLHGKTQELSFPVSLSNDPKGFQVIDGEARVDTREFGLPVIRKFALLKVDPVVTVRFHLQTASAASDKPHPPSN